MREHDPRKTFGRVALACAAWALLLAVVKLGALWPYQLTRWAMCGAAVWAAFNVRGWRLAVAGAIAVVYNPIDPLAFGSLWRWVNVLTAVGWLAVYPWSERVKRGVIRPLRWLFFPPAGSNSDDVWLHYFALVMLVFIGFAVAVFAFAKDKPQREKGYQDSVNYPGVYGPGPFPKLSDDALRKLDEGR
jgi:hypothetical protein